MTKKACRVSSTGSTTHPRYPSPLHSFLPLYPPLDITHSDYNLNCPHPTTSSPSPPTPHQDFSSVAPPAPSMVTVDPPSRPVEFMPSKTPYDPRHMLAGMTRYNIHSLLLSLTCNHIPSHHTSSNHLPHPVPFLFLQCRRFLCLWFLRQRFLQRIPRWLGQIRHHWPWSFRRYQCRCHRCGNTVGGATHPR